MTMSSENLIGSLAAASKRWRTKRRHRRGSKSGEVSLVSAVGDQCMHRRRRRGERKRVRK